MTDQLGATHQLGATLRAVAERVPPADVPPDLFDRARARHRRRLATRAAAGAVVLLLSVGYVASAVTDSTRHPVGTGRAALDCPVSCERRRCAPRPSASPRRAPPLPSSAATRQRTTGTRDGTP